MLTGFAQLTSRRIPLIGTVESVSGDSIHVKVRTEIVTLDADAKTSVWYAKEYHDFSQVKAGDKVSVDAERLPDGKLRAMSVWVNCKRRTKPSCRWVIE